MTAIVYDYAAINHHLRRIERGEPLETTTYASLKDTLCDVTRRAFVPTQYIKRDPGLRTCCNTFANEPHDPRKPCAQYVGLGYERGVTTTFPVSK